MKGWNDDEEDDNDHEDGHYCYYDGGAVGGEGWD